MPHHPISIRLSHRAHEILSADAAEHNQSVSQVIRLLAERHAVALRRARIRAESEAVAARYRSDPDVREFYDDMA